MPPLDQMPPNERYRQENFDKAAACARSERSEEQKVKIKQGTLAAAPVPAGAGDAPDFLFGPDAAQFDAPPASEPEPAEPDEQVGETLTERQLSFCERYVERPVAALAAREAGYAPSTAA